MNRILLYLLFSIVITHSFIHNFTFAQTQSEIDNNKQETNEEAIDLNEENVYAVRPKAELKFYQPGDIIHFKNPHYLETEFTNYFAKLGQTQIIKIPNNGYDDIFAGIDINISPGEYLISLETDKKQIELLPFIITMPEKVHFLAIADSNNQDRKLAEKSEVVKNLIWSNLLPKFPFKYPIENTWSKTFGYYYETNLENLPSSKNAYRKNISHDKNSILQRVDHLSITVDAPTTVQSPSDAVCFSIQFDENHGYTVLLDHGMGLFSEISGLRNITISEQDRIKKDSVISTFNTLDFIEDDTQAARSQTIKWRVFLNKAAINPHHLTLIE